MNQGRRFWSWVIALTIVILALACSFWADQWVRDWVTEHPNHSAKVFMHYVSRVGDWQGHLAVGLILTGLAWWRRNKKWMRVFVAMLVACALAGMVARAIKVTTGRARPSVKTEQTWNGLQWKAKYHAFPSGHVASSVAFFGVLFFARRRIGLACFPIPILIGFSRIYVGAHYLSDVTFAALLGLVIAYFVARQARISEPQSATK